MVGKPALKFHLKIPQDIGSYAILEELAEIMDKIATAFRAVHSDGFRHQLCSTFEFCCSDGG